MVDKPVISDRVSAGTRQTLQMLERLRNVEDADGPLGRSPMDSATFALIVATAMVSLRTVRQAHADNPDVSSKMPRTWQRLIKAIKKFDRDFGRIVPDKT